MKKAFILMEVIVSIMLITIVIAAILKLQQNSLNLLKKLNDFSLYNSYISFTVNEKTNNNQNIFLSDSFDFKDDEIRQELKTVKVKIKNELSEEIPFHKNKYIDKIYIQKSTYNIENKFSRTFYTFNFQ